MSRVEDRQIMSPDLNAVINGGKAPGKSSGLMTVGPMEEVLTSGQINLLGVPLPCRRPDNF